MRTNVKSQNWTLKMKLNLPTPSHFNPFPLPWVLLYLTWTPLQLGRKCLQISIVFQVFELFQSTEWWAYSRLCFCFTQCQTFSSLGLQLAQCSCIVNGFTDIPESYKTSTSQVHSPSFYTVHWVNPDGIAAHSPGDARILGN